MRDLRQSRADTAPNLARTEDRSPDRQPDFIHAKIKRSQICFSKKKEAIFGHFGHLADILTTNQSSKLTRAEVCKPKFRDYDENRTSHSIGKEQRLISVPTIGAEFYRTFAMFDLPTSWQILLAFVAVSVLAKWMFTPPAELRHLPRVPILPLLWSYVSGEVEDVRIKRLLLPFANEKGEGVVLVYALGRWIVHVLDHQVMFQRL